jgi:hypothetical protein
MKRSYCEGNLKTSVTSKELKLKLTVGRADVGVGVETKLGRPVVGDGVTIGELCGRGLEDGRELAC